MFSVNPSKVLRDAAFARRSCPEMVLDYHECDSTEALVQVLNDLVENCFFLEKVIPQPGDTYIVLFRRRAYG